VPIPPVPPVRAQLRGNVDGGIGVRHISGLRHCDGLCRYKVWIQDETMTADFNTLSRRLVFGVYVSNSDSVEDCSLCYVSLKIIVDVGGRADVVRALAMSFACAVQVAVEGS
jgi:hypothetical protein